MATIASLGRLLTHLRVLSSVTMPKASISPHSQICAKIRSVVAVAGRGYRP